MKTALLSVYNKEGIADFAKELVGMGWKILASGGTAKALADAGIPARDVAEIIGGGAILGHRVVTLSREVHAGLLATNSKSDKQELKRLGIPRIDLLCGDLYPLQKEINNPDSTHESVIEKTDIGGPALLRSAAKGRRIVISDARDRCDVLDWLKKGRPNEKEFVNKLAAKAEAVVAKYCLISAQYSSGGFYDGVIGAEAMSCKYGENARQAPAAFVSAGSEDPLAIDKFTSVAGSEPSYNNLADLDRMLQTLTHIAAVFELNRSYVPFIAVAVKHGNACGAAVASSPIEVIKKMVMGDTRAIFGGAVIVNFEIGDALAELIAKYNMQNGTRRLLDFIAAQSFSPGALKVLGRKGGKCRLVENPSLNLVDSKKLDFQTRFRFVRGGFLKQPNYTFVLNLSDLKVEEIGRKAEAREIEDVLLAWAIGSTSNSNTITLVKCRMLIGNGVGQQDRVGACELAIKRAQDAGHDTEGAVAYSDSFFPFIDGPEILAGSGIRTIFASSGSLRDKEVKEFCEGNDIALYLVPDAIARGFFDH